MFVPEAVIELAVDAIINARDFCGDEMRASRAVAEDHGVGGEWRKVWSIANFRANARWNGFKKDAGVNAKYRF